MLKQSIIIAAMAFSLAACQEAPPTPQTPTAQQQQSVKAAQAASHLTFEKNSEIENIGHRLKLTSNPGQIGFVLLLNQAGQPIMYTSVVGKVTSGSKRLTPSETFQRHDCGEYICTGLGPAPNDEGTYGQSGEYVYFWTVDGNYVQWNGGYLYSDKPFRTNIQPLVIATVH